METVFLAPALPPGPFAAVVLTSEAGALAAGQLPGLPTACFCVGERTAQAARAGGFTPRHVAPTAEALVAVLLSQTPGPILYLHGRDVSVPIDRLLREAGHPAESAVVYDQRESRLSDEAVHLLGRAREVVVPLYSARSVRLFLVQRPAQMAARTWFCAISETVLDALPPDDRARCTVADTPDGAGMASAMRRVISSLLA